MGFVSTGVLVWGGSIENGLVGFLVLEVSWIQMATDT
jgi:hypothetical protein